MTARSSDSTAQFANQMILFKIIQQTSCSQEKFDMALKLIDMNQNGFNYEERKMLSSALKEIIFQKRKSHKVIKAILDQQKIIGNFQKISKLQDIYLLLGKEIIEMCNKVLRAIEASLLPSCPNDSLALSFYTLLQGDMSRSKCECAPTENERKAFVKDAQYRYKRAEELASSLALSHPHRVAISLNYSTLMFEQLHDRPGAIKLAQKALEDSSLMTTDKADDYMDLSKLQRALKENINQWSHVDD